MNKPCSNQSVSVTENSVNSGDGRQAEPSDTDQLSLLLSSLALIVVQIEFPDPKALGRHLKKLIPVDKFDTLLQTHPLLLRDPDRIGRLGGSVIGQILLLDHIDH